MPQVDAFIVAFSLTSIQSFEDAKTRFQAIKENSKSTKFCLVGN